MKRKDNESMKHAYAQTVVDLKVELVHTEWWRFRKLNKLNKEVKHYENLIESLKIND